MTLEHWHAWASTTSLEKPVPLFDHPHIFPNVKTEHLLEQLCAISMCPIIGSQEKRLAPPSSFHLLRKL